MSEKTWKNYAGAAAGGAGGFLGGAKAGAVLGSIAGPVGSGLGALVGGVAGALFFGKQGYQNPSAGMINGAIAIGSVGTANQIPSHDSNLQA